MKRVRIREGSIVWWMRIVGKELSAIIIITAICACFGLFDKPEAVAETETPEIEKLHTVLPIRQELTVAEQIERKCREYDVDAEIAVAIARLETGHFTSKAFTQYNNVGGLSVNEQPIQYGSLDSGIEAFVINLAAYKAAGLVTVEDIGKRWCPANYESWVYNVNKIMGEDYV